MSSKKSITKPTNKLTSFIYENPIDRFLYYYIEKISDTVHSLHITPNIITFFGLVFGLLSAYFLYEKKFINCIILWFISYYLDLLDGYIARKYNQGSTFGGWFDHISDIIKLLLYLYVLYLHDKFNVIYIFILITIIGMTNTSCRTKFLNKEQNPTDSLYFVQKMCPDKNYVKYTRYWGEGLIAFLAPLIILYSYKDEL
jgi:phosphatidylglycerophosphate synthase